MGKWTLTTPPGRRSVEELAATIGRKKKRSTWKPYQLDGERKADAKLKRKKRAEAKAELIPRLGKSPRDRPGWYLERCGRERICSGRTLKLQHRRYFSPECRASEQRRRQWAADKAKFEQGMEMVPDLQTSQVA